MFVFQFFLVVLLAIALKFRRFDLAKLQDDSQQDHQKKLENKHLFF